MSNKPSNAELRRRQAALEALHAVFPLAFPLDDALIRPLAISTRDDIQEWLETARPGLCRRSVMATLHKHCARLTYKRTLTVPGAMRINLQGNPVEPVSAEAVEHARQHIEAVRQRRAEAEIERAQRMAEAEARNAAQHAEAEIRRAAKAAKKAGKAPKPAAKPPAQPAPPVVAKAAPAVIVKKRRAIAVPG